MAILIAIFFAIASRFASQALKKVPHATLESRQIAGLLMSIFRVIVLSIGLFIALDFLGLSGTLTS